MFERYPWHDSIWQQVLSRKAQDRLPHALLLTGKNGIGKREFALQLGQLLLCEKGLNELTDFKNAAPCGRCQACLLNKATTHPDFKLVEPESEGKIISIDQIRELSEYLGLKSQYGKGQVVVISPAEKMNKFAANSLLKTLEEPTPDSLIILITHQPSALLPTIRSRCQQMTFSQPAADIAIQWLHNKKTVSEEAEIKEMLFLANGGPLEALQYLDNNTRELIAGIVGNFSNVATKKADPVVVAKAWNEINTNLLVKWLILWTSHMIRLKFSASMSDSYLVAEDTLKKLAAKIDLHALYTFLDKLIENRRLLDSQANVQLMLEDMLIVWLQLNTNK